MKNINELIGKTVSAIVDQDENGNDISIKCEIIDVLIDDYYFEEKNEPIYITLGVSPLCDVPKDVDFESLHEIPLGNIRKWY